MQKKSFLIFREIDFKIFAFIFFDGKKLTSFLILELISRKLFFMSNHNSKFYFKTACLFSTFRYANRAKNIINKPTVNEDPNVKLIRELRAEIERLRTNITNPSNEEYVDPNARQKLAVKEAQERHLTEEWTEKWKEAAKILDEHKALALKQTGKEIINQDYYLLVTVWKNEKFTLIRKKNS